MAVRRETSEERAPRNVSIVVGTELTDHIGEPSHVSLVVDHRRQEWESSANAVLRGDIRYAMKVIVGLSELCEQLGSPPWHVPFRSEAERERGDHVWREKLGRDVVPSLPVIDVVMDQLRQLVVARR
ncbi:MAG: hypothetical protein IPG17_30455 [Sandaracinaceae bacterium]|nr:hypothetical protein [Sandaracinaceae bacterium]